MADEKVPLIGEFSGPPGNGPRVPVLPRKQEADGVARLDEELRRREEERAAEKAAEEAPKTKSPQEKAADYAKGLAAVGLTAVDARRILETVLVNDKYEETHKLGPLEVVVCTRTYQDFLRALRYLELEKPTYPMGVNDVVARYNMAASLVKYGDKVFVHPRKEDGATDDEIETAFHERLTFIIGKPIAAIDKLQEIMAAFDRKVGAVFAEGAPEDF